MVRYPALGDSCRIGTGASSTAASLPHLLARWIEAAHGEPVEARTGWVADNGLHPVRAQYAGWAETIWTAVGPRLAAAPAPGR